MRFYRPLTLFLVAPLPMVFAVCSVRLAYDLEIAVKIAWILHASVDSADIANVGKIAFELLALGDRQQRIDGPVLDMLIGFNALDQRAQSRSALSGVFQKWRWSHWLNSLVGVVRKKSG
jgi:hypothetical protein